VTREQFLEELPKLAEGYKPAPETINKISNLSLVMFIGPTGVGKTTLIKQSGFNYVPSDNTRLPRPGEIEGVDFYFRQDYDQVVEDIKLGRFLQIAIDGSGDLKATRAAAYPDSGTIAMAIMWNVITQFRNLGFKKTISAAKKNR
jgi:guanylate kinase